jgi:putative peptide zinc metalloprotease protein
VVCTDVRIDAVQLFHLDQPSVASPFGGSLPAQVLPDGRLQPLQPTFRVRLEGCDQDTPPPSEVPGVALLEGERRSWAMRGLRSLAALWHQEAAL